MSAGNCNKSNNGKHTTTVSDHYEEQLEAYKQFMENSFHSFKNSITCKVNFIAKMNDELESAV